MPPLVGLTDVLECVVLDEIDELLLLDVAFDVGGVTFVLLLDGLVRFGAVLDVDLDVLLLLVEDDFVAPLEGITLLFGKFM